MNRKPSLFSRLMTGLIFLFLYAPIFVLIVFSFNDSKSRSVWAGFTLDWYDKLFHDQMILDALYTTLAVSFLASVIATIAGTFAAIGFYNMRKRWRTPLMTVNNIPMVNAEIVTGVSLCLFFVAFFNLWGDFAHWANEAFGLQLPEQLYLGFGTMLIAHITFNIPYVILVHHAEAAPDGQEPGGRARPGLYLDAGLLEGRCPGDQAGHHQRPAHRLHHVGG